MKNLILILLILSGISVSAQTKLVVYDAPKGVELNDDFTVKVRPVGGKWQETPSYLWKVDEVRGTKHNQEKTSLTYFDFDGEIEVSVTYNKGNIETARVRPLSYGIEASVDKNTLTFKLTKASNLSVEVNNDIFHNLQLFANPLETDVPKKKDKDIIYFGAGIHELEDGKLYVPSGKTVYLAGGAVLNGQVLFENVENARLIGRGVIDYKVKGGVHIANSKNILVEGITCTQCATGGSDSVTIRNVKSISYYGWGDGMNVFASNNVLYDRVFCRNSDDCTTVYATRKGYVGGCNNIIMQNSTLWADVAHPIFIGIHGNTPNPEIIENVLYKNIDILDHNEIQVDYQGCISINAGDNNLIRNIRVEDIRVENFRRGQLVNLRIFYNEKYCTAPGRGIEDIYFKNITYNGENSELSMIMGYNKERMVKNVTFENLRINGELIYDEMPDKPAWYKTSDMARIFVGEHVEGIVFKK